MKHRYSFILLVITVLGLVGLGSVLAREPGPPVRERVAGRHALAPWPRPGAIAGPGGWLGRPDDRNLRDRLSGQQMAVLWQPHLGQDHLAGRRRQLFGLRHRRRQPGRRPTRPLPR